MFSIHLKAEEEEEFVSFLQKPENKLLCEPRITLLAYVSQRGSFFHSNYPINILRNIAIRHTTTSHFLLTDTDMMISENAYTLLLDLPKSLVMDEKNAFVLPAIFSRQWDLPDLPLEEQMKAFDFE